MLLTVLSWCYITNILYHFSKEVQLSPSVVYESDKEMIESITRMKLEYALLLIK